MSNLLSRITRLPQEVSAPQEAVRPDPAEANPLQTSASGFQKFVIDKPWDVPGQAPLISPAQHQAARRRLFDRLVRHVLNQKGHPFAGLDHELKQDMINSITEEMVQSHYKI